MTAELRRAARTLRTARQRLDAAMAAAARAAATAAAEGVPETTISEELGVTRMTVRRWLGK